MHPRFERNSTMNGLREGSGTMTDESELEQQDNEVKQNGSVHGVTVTDTGFCTLCGKTSVCKCERCGDFYCSPLCQRKDWSNHRFICFPMPRLVNAGQKVENQNGGRDNNVPQLKADIKPADLTKAENRHFYKARQSETPLPKTGCCVVLTGFKSSNRCYIRAANPTTTDEYLKILKKIDNFGKSSTELDSAPTAYSFAVAQKDGKWCRVKVLKVRPDNQIRLQFIDCGTIRVYGLSELRKISGTISSLPCYVNVVQLHGITNYSNEESLLNELSVFTGREYRVQYVENDEAVGSVELYHWGSNNLLNSEIINLCRRSNDKGHKAAANSSSNNGKPKANGSMERNENKKASPSTAGSKDNSKSKIDTVQKGISETPVGRDKKRNLPPAPRQIQIQKPCLDPPFETITFDENEQDFTVYVVDSSYVSRGYVGCLLEKYAENLKSITKYLKSYNANDQPYKPKLNEYCLAQFDNEWYRAKVIEVLGEDSYQVVYIDFSNELELTSQSIRRYPMSLTLPCCTSLCVIEGLPEEFSDDLIEFLEKKYGDFQKLTVDKVKIIEGVCFIESKELIKILHDSQLI